jgi:hypothetical protein
MERLKAIKYYQGEPLGTEVEGRSTIVMRNVLEAVEWVLPALIRIFTASDQICVVEPTKPEDEAVAKIATEYLTHIFYRDNEGFMILHDWFKDALLEKLGWVKYWWDLQETTENKTYSGATREQYDALLTQDPDAQVEVKEEREYEKPAADGDEAPGDWDIEATREQSYLQEAGGWNLTGRSHAAATGDAVRLHAADHQTAAAGGSSVPPEGCCSAGRQAGCAYRFWRIGGVGRRAI